MAKTIELTEAEEMTQRMRFGCQQRHNLLADLAGKGGDWRRIYGFIYKCWHAHRPLFPDVDTMADMIAEKRNSTKRNPS